MKVYVASSWRNRKLQASVCQILSREHDVYDFTNPAPGNTGFAWSAIDEHWLKWSPEAFRRALDHPIARSGFALDMEALKACDACVLVLPCGRSAHLELGYAVGAGKRAIVFCADGQGFEPELMYLMCGAFVTSTSELLNALAVPTYVEMREAQFALAESLDSQS